MGMEGLASGSRLTEAEPLDVRHWPLSIDPFNKVLTFEFRHGPNDSDIWMVPLEGDRKPRPLLVRPYFQSHAVFFTQREVARVHVERIVDIWTADLCGAVSEHGQKTPDHHGGWWCAVMVT